MRRPRTCGARQHRFDCRRFNRDESVTSMDKFDRIFQLHALLNKRRTPISIEDLADRMECKRPTVFRAIKTLKDKLGAPVLFDKDHRGYRYDAAGGRFDLPGLWFN